VIREYTLLGLLAGLWGSSYLFAKVALESLGPITLAATRVTVAAVVLSLVLAMTGKRLPSDASTWQKLLRQSLLNSTIAWSVLAWGQQYVDSGLAGVLNSTSPIFVVLFTLTFLRRERVGGWQVFGALLGFAGVITALGVDVLRPLGRDVLAQFATLFSAFLYALAAVHGRQLAHLSPLVTAAATTLLAAACLVPAALVIERPWACDPSLRSLLAASALAFFCTAIALLVYFRLLRTLGPMGVTSQSYLRAGFSVLLGMLVLGERVSLAVGIGLAAIILGVAAINYRGTRSRAQAR
jgi:drug/metabolite transporter (DMT)-like permease